MVCHKRDAQVLVVDYQSSRTKVMFDSLQVCPLVPARYIGTRRTVRFLKLPHICMFKVLYGEERPVRFGEMGRR